MIVFKDPLKKLQDHGWSAYRLVKERQLGNGTITRLRNGESITTDTIDTICKLLDCQPGDILEYKKGED